MNKIELHLGNITSLSVDVIVNAANSHLIAGSGVCGAIHRTAGRELEKECLPLAPCAAGDAVITKGYHLKAKAVVHTVGPKYFNNPESAPALLVSCYRNSLRLANENGHKSIAFPCISTGVYGYPKEAAALVAFSTVTRYLPETNIEKVVFCCFDSDDLSVYQNLLMRQRLIEFNHSALPPDLRQAHWETINILPVV